MVAVLQAADLSDRYDLLADPATGEWIVCAADNGLCTAQTLQEYRDSRDVYHTHVDSDLRESLDHVLVSEQLYDNSLRRVWLFDGLTIANDHLDDENHRTTGTTDHGPVKVRFRSQPYAP
jgi:hypothetical protein